MHQATYTPEWLARDMAGLADIQDGHYILEPSAGRGALLSAIPSANSIQVVAYELNRDNWHVLNDAHGSFGQIIHKNFLQADPPVYMQRYFDRVIMNPPLKDPDEHVRHACKFLDAGGRLVALLHSHAAKTVVRELEGAREYRIAGGTFFIENREVDASLIVWDKPL